MHFKEFKPPRSVYPSCTSALVRLFRAAVMEFNIRQTLRKGGNFQITAKPEVIQKCPKVGFR